MTENERPVGEDDLHAYVDGRLDPERRRIVEAYLAEQPDHAGRVQRYAEQRAALKDSLRAKFEEPIPTRLRMAQIAVRVRRSAPSRRRAAIAAILLFAVGIATGWVLNDYRYRQVAPVVAAPSLPNDAIAAYRTYVGEKLHAVEVAASEEKHLVQWLSRRLGRPLTTPDLTPFGYRLMGGRLLPASAGPAAQFMYEDQQGKRLTLYLRPGEQGETSFRFVQKDGISAFYWIEDGFAYAVSAEKEREVLLKTAESIYKQCAPQ